MRRILALVLTASTSAAVSPQEIPRFKSGVDVVQFTVTVLDKGRHPIAGLTASDFEALVDGKPVPLAAFAAVTLPDEPSTGAGVSVSPVAPDVLTSRLPAEGRLVVIVMDRSIPDGQPMQAAHTIANAAIVDRAMEDRRDNRLGHRRAGLDGRHRTRPGVRSRNVKGVAGRN